MIELNWNQIDLLKIEQKIIYLNQLKLIINFFLNIITHLKIIINYVLFY